MNFQKESVLPIAVECASASWIVLIGVSAVGSLPTILLNACEAFVTKRPLRCSKADICLSSQANVGFV